MKWKKLSQKEFEQIKTFQKAEIKQADVSRLLKRSRGVVNRVYIVDSFQSYREKIRNVNGKRKSVRLSPTTEPALALIYKNDLAELHAKLDLILHSLSKKKVIL